MTWGGAYGERHVDKALVWVAFHIELAPENRTEFVYVVACDMPLVGARVHGDAVGTEALDVERYGAYVGIILAACVAQSGNFVYINA